MQVLRSVAWEFASDLFCLHVMHEVAAQGGGIVFCVCLETYLISRINRCILWNVSYALLKKGVGKGYFCLYQENVDRNL